MPAVMAAGADTGAGTSAPGVPVLDVDPSSDPVAQQAPSQVLSPDGSNLSGLSTSFYKFSPVPSISSVFFTVALLVVVLAVRRRRRSPGQHPQRLVHPSQHLSCKSASQAQGNFSFGLDRIQGPQQHMHFQPATSALNFDYYNQSAEKTTMEDESRAVSDQHAAGRPHEDLFHTPSTETLMGTMESAYPGDGVNAHTGAVPSHEGQQYHPPWLQAQPPLVPPLTPMQPSRAVFTLGHKRSGLREQGQSFDSTVSSRTGSDAAASPESATSALSRSPSSPAGVPPLTTARRRSYTKMIPQADAQQQSPTEPGQMPSFPVHSSYSPSPTSYPAHAPSSSYASSSPMVPPPPPPPSGGVDIVHGEIVYVTDDAGHGWKRHTRVYGGGPCQACAAAVRDGLPGGFYGRTIRPEDMGRAGMGGWR